jgi:hypothetical protein
MKLQLKLAEYQLNSGRLLNWLKHQKIHLLYYGSMSLKTKNVECHALAFVRAVAKRSDKAWIEAESTWGDHTTASVDAN